MKLESAGVISKYYKVSRDHCRVNPLNRHQAGHHSPQKIWLLVFEQQGNQLVFLFEEVAFAFALALPGSLGSCDSLDSFTFFSGAGALDLGREDAAWASLGSHCWKLLSPELGKVVDRHRLCQPKTV